VRAVLWICSTFSFSDSFVGRFRRIDYYMQAVGLLVWLSRSTVFVASRTLYWLGFTNYGPFDRWLLPNLCDSEEQDMWTVWDGWSSNPCGLCAYEEQCMVDCMRCWCAIEKKKRKVIHGKSLIQISVITEGRNWVNLAGIASDWRMYDWTIYGWQL